METPSRQSLRRSYPRIARAVLNTSLAPGAVRYLSVIPTYWDPCPGKIPALYHFERNQNQELHENIMNKLVKMTNL